MQNAFIQRSQRTHFSGDSYSDLFGKKKSAEEKAAKQIAKAKLKGDKERAKMGLDEIPVSGAATPEAGSNKTMIYAGIGVAVLVVIVIVIFISKKK